jgi:hypothetical protein
MSIDKEKTEILNQLAAKAKAEMDKGKKQADKTQPTSWSTQFIESFRKRDRDSVTASD